MFVSMSVDIEAPPEVVWPYLVEPEKTKAWFTALKEYDWTSEARGVGATFHWFEEAGGREYNIDFETTEWDPPHVFGYQMTEGDFFKLRRAMGHRRDTDREPVHLQRPHRVSLRALRASNRLLRGEQRQEDGWGDPGQLEAPRRSGRRSYGVIRDHPSRVWDSIQL